MKKVFVMLFAIVGVSLALQAGQYAQCKIAGGDGATASVSLGDYNESTGKVTVYFSNDSDKPTTICCKVKSSGLTLLGETCTTVPPASETKKEVYVGKDYAPSNIEVSSARCE